MNSKIKCDNKLIGKRIASSRKTAGMTQECLARKIGIGIKHISQIERGISGVAVGTLIELAKHLNVSTDYILLGKEPQGSPLNVELNNITPNQKQCLEEIMKVFISFCMDDKQLNTTSDEDVCKKILMGNNN